MTLLQQRLQELIEEFDELDDGFSRYAYLVELASLLPPYPEELRTDDHLVQSCQSRVWLAPREEKGAFYFDADSDTLIIKGILLVLSDLLCGLPVSQAAELDLDILTSIGLRQEFSDQRQKGIAAAISILKEAARSFHSTGPA